MVEYILATKFYNEQNQLPGLIANIAAQIVAPKTVVFLDDGSVDSSAEIAAKEATRHGLEFKIVSMPVKKKGNLDTLGRVWTKAQPLLKVLSKNVEYCATLDVDTRVEPSYFKDMISYLETHPSIGVVAGQAQNQPKRTFPMFAGKVFRSTILNSIDEYWDISIDSFINVKALKMGYRLSILDGMKVETPISHLQTKKGKFRAGRLAFYSGSDLLYVLIKGILLHDAQYLRGYWSESSRGTWRCQDEEILEFFSGQFKRKMLNYVKKALRL